jgi:hypothetical protein
VPSVAYCNATPRKLYGFDGQPGSVTTGFPFRIIGTPVAPVGLGSADGMPPHDAHDPIAMTAPALPPTSLRMSTAVRPPTWQ